MLVEPIIIYVAVIAFAFFIQSVMGFGGGLIAVPLLSLFFPVQDVVNAVIAYNFCMGLLLFKSWRMVEWGHVKKLMITMVVGSLVGIAALKYVPGDGLRLVLAGYIILHLLREMAKMDYLKYILGNGGVYSSGFIGGALNSMLGSGAPAFVLYMKKHIPDARALRVSAMTVLFFANFPRVAGAASAGMITQDVLYLAVIGLPGFFVALYAGQKLHDKVPQQSFHRLVDVILIGTALSLIVKVVL